MASFPLPTSQTNPAAQHVRVRIAPSPTGNLHIGTARAALFNWLFAKKHGGTFILRLEDTDLARSKPEFTQSIYDGLRGLGLNWDEGPDTPENQSGYGPYTQSQRLPIYNEWLQKLIERDCVYKCYLTEEELTGKRALAAAENMPFVYRETPEDAELNHRRGQTGDAPYVYRFRVPVDHAPVVVHDAIRGDVQFDVSTLGDFIIMKQPPKHGRNTLAMPTFNFANVVDDASMAITHIIRGEDHLPNTPRQILLYEAFGIQPPVFAHASMILAPDRSKLSKRHGATALAEFLAQGYLPEAMGNFLALLGWSPTDGQEIATLEHFASQFSLDRIAQSPAVFDIEKLNWLNGQYIRAMSLAALLEKSRPYLQSFDLSAYSSEQLELMLEVVREPLIKLDELPEAVSYFFDDALSVPEALQHDVIAPDEGQQVLRAFNDTFLTEHAAIFSQPVPQAREAMQAALKAFIGSLKPLKAKQIMWPIRAALTGRVHGAELASVLILLGLKRCKQRAQAAVAAQV
ncbi:MAG: glutamate--tRNA ligase [Vampirovibrionales bacterium]|nr:glutamate--tRNA ligase [Vampirovibrionales bacterium]